MNMTAMKEAVARSAAECGAQGYELSIHGAESAGAEALHDEISSVSYARADTMSVRCVVDGKSGYAVSELVTPEAAAELVAMACDNARVADDVDEVSLFSGSGEYRQVEDAADQLPSAEALKALALELQRKVYAVSGKIVDGTQCSASAQRITQVMLNSAGLELEYGASLTYQVATAAVKDDSDAANDFRVAQAGKETTDDTAAKVVENALSKLGGQSVPSGKYAVVLASGAVRDLLGTFATVFSARSAYLKTSLLAGREGDVVASPAVTLVDDPFHPEKFGHCPFDGEGVAVYTKNVIENGVLKTLLYNRMYGKLLGKATTGNAASAKTIEPKGLYFAPGTETKESILERMGSGLYLTELQGLHSGTNPQSGDFSLQAEGFLVEGGKKTRPVKNFTIADNFFDLLKKVEALSDHAEFSLTSDFGAPDLLISETSIAGSAQ